MKTITEPLAEWDIVAVVVYFFLVLLVGLYSMYKSKRDTVNGYFLAGRHMTWIPVGASLFASNIGSDHFIGLAGSGAAAGIAVGAFELNALALLQLLGWVFLPVYIASRVSTLPEFMSKRFGRERIRILLATLSLILYIFTKISVNMYAGALFIKITLGWNLYVSIVALLVMTAICTVAGGLTAVMYTDTLQCAIMVIGSIIVCIKSFIEVGGYEGLQEKYSTATAHILPANSTCGQPRPDSWSMLRDPVDSDMPWISFIVGQTPASIWYWCTDQMMVQRALASKSLSHAQGVTLFAGYLKLLPLFVMVMPGMISRILYPDIVGCAVPEECMKYCDSPSGCSNMAYPLLVFGIMPAGVRGVMLAVMMAALMSDLTSVFNSASTLFTIDMWKYWRPTSSTRELLFVGKVFVCMLAVVSVLWVPIILQMQGGQLYLYIQAIAAYIAPPIAAVYLLAVLWKRMNEQGAFWSLMLGFVVGSIRMGLDFYYVEPICGEPDLRPDIIRKVHYMSFAAIMFWLTLLVAVVVSLCTSPSTPQQLWRTTYWTRLDQEFKVDSGCEFVTSPSFRSPLRSSGRKPRPGVGPANGDIIRPRGVRITSMDATITTTQPKVGQGSGNENQACEEWISTRTLNYDDDLKTVITADDSEVTSSVPAWKKCWFWFCGYNTSPECEREAAAAEMRAHLNRLSSLEQAPRTVTFLRINLAFILLVTLVMYLYFTFWAAPAITS